MTRRPTLRPTLRLAAVIVAPWLLAIAGRWVPALLWLVLALDLLIVLVAWFDRSRERATRVELTRVPWGVLSVGRDNAVALEVRSTHPRTLEVEVNDDGFERGEVGSLPTTVRLEPARRVRIGYTVRPASRGRFALGSLHLRYRSPLGLWWHKAEVPTGGEAVVYPDIRIVHAFEILARRERELAMLRVGRRRGGEAELDALRPYSAGDAVRNIDWKATARHGGLIVRQFKVEENQNVFFVLDGGRTMTAEHDGLSLFDHAFNAALLLAHVAIRHGDNVGAARILRGVEGFMPLTRGRRASTRLVHTLLEVFPQPVEAELDRGLEQVAHAVRRRSLVVLFTQVLDGAGRDTLLAAVRRTARRHVVLTVLFEDRELNQLALVGTGETATEQAFTRAAAAELLLEREALTRSLQAAGAFVLHVLPRDLTPRLIGRYLDIKAERLL